MAAARGSFEFLRLELQLIRPNRPHRTFNMMYLNDVSHIHRVVMPGSHPPIHLVLLSCYVLCCVHCGLWAVADARQMLGKCFPTSQ